MRPLSALSLLDASISKALDYNPDAAIMRDFFATVQNKMHYAVHKHTAAEIIYERVDNQKPMKGD